MRLAPRRCASPRNSTCRVKPALFPGKTRTANGTRSWRAATTGPRPKSRAKASRKRAAMRIAALSDWTSDQKHVVAATFLGWTLDAFDFFLLVFVLKDIAAEFHTDIANVTVAILLTLAMRPVGAYLFGRAADRWGRRPTLMVDV